MKIMITGQSCSGKSTLAAELSGRLDLALISMDSLIWKEGWVKEDMQVYREKELTALSEDNWVFEGFNPSNLHNQIPHADVVVYITVTRAKQFKQWLKRLYEYRQTSRPGMPDGNIESFNRMFLRWLWKYNDNQIIQEIEVLKPKKLVIVESGSSINHIMEDI